MYILKTNTAVRIPVGPLVDSTDGKTAETTLNVADLSVQLYQIKNDGSAVVRVQFAPTASGGDNDMILVPSSTDGMYDLELTAAQLNWLGNGRVTFYDLDSFLVHWLDIQVVSASHFDWIFGSTIPDVNVTKVSGTAQTAKDIGAIVDKLDTALELDGAVYRFTANALENLPLTVADIAAAVWSAAVRTLTSIQDSAGITTLLSRVTGAVALASTALSNLVWTDTKAGYIDAPISEAASPPTVEQIRAEIDANSTQLANILAAIALISGGVGTGPTPKTYTITVDGVPCADVLVIMSTDEAGTFPIHSGRTNALGKITFYPDLPAGTKVYLWRYKTGVSFVNPDEEQI